MKNYKGYPLFNNVKNRKLQAFNRLNTILNINEDVGEDLAKRYAEQLDEAGRADLLFMTTVVKKFGKEKVAALIARGE